jgi:hypothetical protein
LKLKARRVPRPLGKTPEFYILFSRMGFSDELISRQSTDPLFLVEGDHLLEPRPISPVGGGEE